MPDFNPYPAEPNDPAPQATPRTPAGTAAGGEATQADRVDERDPLAQPETPQDGAAAETGRIAELQARVAELQARVAELEDEHLRAQAEVQNTRRRASEEMSKARKFAITEFAENLLSVVDSLEAALNVKNATAEQLLEGTLATHRQLLGVLERNQVTEVNPAPGDKFDPALQHAISTVQTDAQPAGTVVAVMQKGYVLAERVLRPALVTVAQDK
ncbi:MAG: nucleotide exchange factor GrpE [Ottowia sp.]|nr:nucleotide exchange factor GrpE [Ottowia sp.]